MTDRFDRGLRRGAVIFDCDGTLVDSEPLARTAWERALAVHGYALTDADAEASIGLPYPRVHAYFAERVPLPAAEPFWGEFSGELFALIDSDLVPFDDAVGAARELRARGIPVGVASSSPRERLQRTLGRAGLLDDVRRGGGGRRGRQRQAGAGHVPARGRAARRGAAGLHRDRGQPAGRAGGLAAGMHTIAVCRVPGTEETLAAADRVVDFLTADMILAT